MPVFVVPDDFQEVTGTDFVELQVHRKPRPISCRDGLGYLYTLDHREKVSLHSLGRKH